MKKGRMEAFSDGVLAIVITIMVLELKPPQTTSLDGLLALTSNFVSYLLSFLYLGIYWNNHHHLLQVTQKVNGSILWANLHLLFWLSLVPFSTAWVGEADHYLHALPVAVYGFVLLMSGIAYFLLERTLIKHHDENFALTRLGKTTLKDGISVAIYLISIPLAFVSTWLAIACFVIVAGIWLVPEKALEAQIEE